MLRIRKRDALPQFRYGIGEWYGKLLTGLSRQERQSLAALQQIPKGQRPPIPCPFRGSMERVIPCSKDGGVCSIRLYQMFEQAVSVAPGGLGILRVTCPFRFYEGNKIFSWVSAQVLGNSDPLMVKEVQFLQKPSQSGPPDGDKRDDVGRIDMILVDPSKTPLLSWCALEIQAVYFSGDSMKREFAALASSAEPLPFPVGRRRPDDRSSGPKRLMPQLQIKVPTLRRWGKKMAVVVDRGFFHALGPMDLIADLSNCDIIWFVVGFEEAGSQAMIRLDDVRFTTLERAVEGLTGGIPVSKTEFERRIVRKLRSSERRARDQ